VSPHDPASSAEGQLYAPRKVRFANIMEDASISKSQFRHAKKEQG
jgi:hypothetical protein